MKIFKYSIKTTLHTSLKKLSNNIFPPSRERSKEQNTQQELSINSLFPFKASSSRNTPLTHPHNKETRKKQHLPKKYTNRPKSATIQLTCLCSFSSKRSEITLFVQRWLVYNFVGNSRWTRTFVKVPTCEEE